MTGHDKNFAVSIVMSSVANVVVYRLRMANPNGMIVRGCTGQRHSAHNYGTPLG